MEKQEILRIVKDCIRDVYAENGYDPNELDELFLQEDLEDTDLYFHIGFDSMDMAELIIKIYDATNINIPDSELVKINTIGDVINTLETLQ